MRMRKVVAGLALGTTVGLGLTAAPAQAASTTSPTASASTRGVVDIRGAEGTLHFYSSHPTMEECKSRAAYWVKQHPSWVGWCISGIGTDGKYKYHLYMEY
ncbi:hypothetical protein GCM10009654_23010 [Streptomyces hebeiensis]|uniref:Secreted protein n=1 Tax=Streptomyces hebeiensis TaxID=229486 RepID=A0ABN1US57_9ACTN